MRQEFAYLKKGRRSFPVMDVELKGKKRSLVVKALVDSGATYSIFRPEIADYLGIDIEKGKPIYLEKLSGRILGHIHRLRARVLDKDFYGLIIFSQELSISFNLLGRNNFFRYFRITFDELGQKVVVDTG
jgi:hypothetical protein